jgi:hypothetical protein
MTEQEKAAMRAELLKALGMDQPQQTPAPLPPGITPGTLAPNAAESVSDLYINGILNRDHNTWNPTERDAMRVAIGRALKELGYQ